MSEETNKKPQITPNEAADNSGRPAKRTHSKEVLARARRIQAVRRAEESKKAAEERKKRMAKRAEDKKKLEEAKKVAEAKKTAATQKAVATAPHAAAKSVKEPLPEIELVDFAVTARKYKTQLTRKFKERKFWEDPSPYEILSYIPGTIISVDVKAGKVVEEGTQLLILEAMKMQNRVDMPFTARIKKINVKAGEKIPKDFVMIELDPEVK